MELSEKNFQAIYQLEAHTVAFRGTLRFSDLSPSYKSLEQFCARIIDQEPEKLALDLAELQDMNLAGMNLLIRFVKRIYELKKSRVVVYLSPREYRQRLLHKLLHKLIPELVLEIA